MRSHIVARFAAALPSLPDTRLKPHQRRIFLDVAAHLSDGAWQAICVAPTASGKTDVFLHLVKASCAQLPDGGGLLVPNTIVLVPTVALVAQTWRRFQDPAFSHLPVGFLSEVHGEAFGPICVTTYESFVQRVLDGRIRHEDVDHIVMDEAHRALSDMRLDVFGRFLGNTLITAFTASPVYDLSKHLYALLGQENKVTELTLREMVDAGVLAPAVNYVVGVRVRGDLPKGFRARNAILSRAALDAVLDLYRNHREGVFDIRVGDRAFFGYTWMINEAREAAEAFGAAVPGGRYASLAGTDPVSRQSETIEELATGTLDGIFNARLLVEGIDVPRVSLILNLDPTDSLVMELQRCGRGLRIDLDAPEGRERKAVIIDVYFEVNGRIQGRPRFMFEALDDMSIARIVETEVRYVGEITGAVRPAAGPPRLAWSSPRDRTPGDGRGEHTIESDVDCVRYLLRRRDQAEDREAWLKLPEVRRRLRVTVENKRFDGLWRGMAATLDSGLAVMDGRRAVAFERRHLTTVSGSLPECLHVDEIPWLADKLGLYLGPVTEDAPEWLGRFDLCARLGCHAYNETLMHALAKLEASYRADGMASLDGEPFVAGFCKREGGGRIFFAVHEDEAARLGSRLGFMARLPSIDEGWLTMQAASRALGFKSVIPRVRQAWKELDRCVAEGRTTDDMGWGLRIALLRNRLGTNAVCMRTADLDALAKAMDVRIAHVSEINERWLVRNAVAAALPIHDKDENLVAVFEAIDRLGVEDGLVKVDGILLRGGLRRSRGHRPPCLHADSLTKLRKLLGKPLLERKGTDWLSKADIARHLDVNKGDKRLAEAFKAMLVELEAGRCPYRVSRRLNATGSEFTARGQYRSVPCIHAGDLRRFLVDTGLDVRRRYTRRTGAKAPHAKRAATKGPHAAA